MKSEIAKTTVFVIVAVVATAVAGTAHWMHFRQKPILQAADMIGKPLFADFTDPLKATSLEIVEYDEETGEPSTFEVALVNNQWSIPSHADYPADAKDQLAAAAASMIGLTVLTMPSEDPAEHEMYGVIDPDPKTVKPGAVGVGTRVTMKNKQGKSLLALVIGKQLKDQDELRYVRRAGQHPVYTAKVKTDKLSSKFEDWIEDDLLKLDSWDIKQIRIQDYSVDELRRQIQFRRDMTVKYESGGDPPWQLVADKVPQPQAGQMEWVSLPLADDEELDETKLNDMKSALDDLKIIDVARKPEGLSADLKATKSFLDDGTALTSLSNRGFYVLPTGSDKFEVVSNEGEIRCLMKDGVEYVLRFGDLAETPESESSAKPSRYIFATCEFNPEPIEKPKLEPLPEPEEKPAEKAAGDPAAPEKETSDAASEQDKAATDDADSDAPGDASGEEKKKDDEKSEAEKERERIEKENKRKQEEYDEKIAEGKKKVDGLNARFADWYYIIPDEEYQKIHLGRDQIVKKKEKDKDEDKSGDAGSGDGSADQEPTEETPAQEGGEDAAADQPPASPIEEFDDLKAAGPEGDN